MARKKKSTSVGAEVTELDAVEEAVVEEVVEAETAEVTETAIEDSTEGFFDDIVEEVVELAEEAKEEVVEITPEPVVEKVEEVKETVVRTANKAKHSFDAWWNEVGKPAYTRGYNVQGLLKKAKGAFGPEFDETRYNEYLSENRFSTTESSVKAVWDSQK